MLFQNVSFSGNTYEPLHNSKSECKNQPPPSDRIKASGVIANGKERERDDLPTAALFPLVYISDFFFLQGNRGGHKMIQCLAPG